eukprot:s2696_g9.t1
MAVPGEIEHSLDQRLGSIKGCLEAGALARACVREKYRETLFVKGAVAKVRHLAQDLKRHFLSLRQEMDALKADNDALKQSSHPPKGKANDTNKLEQLELENEVLNEQINELKAQLYMSSAMGDDEWFKNSATRMAWLAGADSGSNGISTIFRKESPKKVSFSQVVPKPEEQDERPPSASPFEIEQTGVYAAELGASS